MMMDRNASFLHPWSEGMPGISPDTVVNDLGINVQTGEPMEVAMRLLKRAKSKEALANKKKYDTNYHATPERKKYRVDLKRERRQRGVYGKGGKDMSHTKDGKLTPEDPSSNRARQSKAKGTLK